MIQVLTVKNFW